MPEQAGQLHGGDLSAAITSALVGIQTSYRVGRGAIVSKPHRCAPAPDEEHPRAEALPVVAFA